MNEYVVVYSYDGTFNYTYSIRVLANNYGEVEKNIKEVFDNGVEMTTKECNLILKNEWYYIEILDSDNVYRIGD